MPDPQGLFAASLASEAVEVLEDHLLFPDANIGQNNWGGISETCGIPGKIITTAFTEAALIPRYMGRKLEKSVVLLR